MLALILAVALVVLASFGFVLAFGAPYLPTLSPQVDAALELAGLQKGQRLLELGCGDGKVLIAAARRGNKAVGYELNPILAFIAWVRTRRYGAQVKVVWGNFWTAKWPPSEAIFTFLLPKYMARLDKRIVRSGQKPIKLVSFAFTVPGKKPKAERSGVYLYEY